METLILTSLLASMGISTFISKDIFFAGYLRLAMFCRVFTHEKYGVRIDEEDDWLRGFQLRNRG